MIPTGPWLVVLLLALTGFSLLAYAMRILDAPGAVGSFVLGLIIILGGGLRWLLLMAVFTGLAFVATRVGVERKKAIGLLENDGERGLPNVIGNGLAAGIVAALAFWVESDAVVVAFVTAVAAIAADTMGSEIGCMTDRARRITPWWPRVPAGQNGAVSWLGQGAALAGATTIAVAALLLQLIDQDQTLIALVGGFLGSQVDSLLGATLEKDAVRTRRPLGKQSVNFLAGFVPAAFVLAWLL